MCEDNTVISVHNSYRFSFHQYRHNCMMITVLHYQKVLYVKYAQVLSDYYASVILWKWWIVITSLYQVTGVDIIWQLCFAWFAITVMYNSFDTCGKAYLCD